MSVLGVVLASLFAIGAFISMGMPPAASQVPDPSATEPAPDETTDSELTTAVERLIQSATDLKGARIGVYARVLGQKSPLLSIRGADGYNSASNTKIVTTAAALALLGPGYSFSTGLWASGISKDGASAKTLYLVGGGDPSLGIDHVDALARDLVATGLRSIERIAVDDSFFDSEETPPHFDEQPKEQAAFRAPVNAAGLGFNSFAVHVIANPKGSGPAKIILDPPVDYLNVVQNEVSTVTRGRARIRVETSPRKGRLDIRIRGQIRLGSPRRVRRRVPNPTAFAGSVLRWSLKRAGLKVVSRSSRQADLAVGARLLAARRSDSVAVLVRGLGKYSNNYMAETLLKTIGAETDKSDAPATWETALAAVSDYLANDVGLRKDAFRYGNGSGLFDSNRFSPEQIARVLEHAASDARSGSEFVSSLAIGGVDGTLRSRMDLGPERGLVRAKTGTLARVSALSGFASQTGHPPVVFSILVNEVPPGEIDAARKLQDRIAALLVAHAGQP